MAIKPCLIFTSYALRPTDGGPSGFLAQNLVGQSSPYFDFKGDKIWTPWSWKKNLQSALRDEPLRTMKQMGFTTHTPLGVELVEARRAFSGQGAAQYPWVWFHDVARLAGCADMLVPGQRVILQSHCPELPAQELANVGANAEDVEWLRKAERFAFNRADVLVFPDEGALSIYESIIPSDKRIEIVPSGSAALRPRAFIPLDATLVYYLYIGRRIPVKGFDIVIDAFSRAHAVDDSLRLILLGGGTRIDAPGVLDIGRADEPSVWMAACDYMISANRQSYFDLAIMEALSLGTPLIMACTGGHQYFARTPSAGVYCMTSVTVDGLAEDLLKNRRKRSVNTDAQVANQDLHRREFSSEKYRARLDQLLQSLPGI